MALTIHETDHMDLYHGDNEHAVLILAIDVEDVFCRISRNGETPVDVFHRRAISWRLPMITGASANRLMRTLLPLLEQIADEVDIQWNGSNYVGSPSERADRLIYEVEYEIELRTDPADELQVWDAADYMAPVGSLEQQAEELGITANTTDAELERIGEQLEDESEVDILDGVERYLERLREAVSED